MHLHIKVEKANLFGNWVVSIQYGGRTMSFPYTATKHPRGMNILKLLAEDSAAFDAVKSYTEWRKQYGWDDTPEARRHYASQKLHNEGLRNLFGEDYKKAVKELCER